MMGGRVLPGNAILRLFIATLRTNRKPERKDACSPSSEASAIVSIKAITEEGQR